MEKVNEIFHLCYLSTDDKGLYKMMCIYVYKMNMKYNIQNASVTLHVDCDDQDLNDIINKTKKTENSTQNISWTLHAE